MDRVLLASPRGFCAGVEMAIKALAWMTRVFEPPVYCYHEIVHNQVVVERFRQLGVVFVDDVAEVPEGAPLMLSAHGSPPRGGRRRPGPGRRGRQRRVPAGEEGPPRGQGASRQGVHHRVRRSRGPPGGGRHAAVAPEAVHRVEHLEELDGLPDPTGRWRSWPRPPWPWTSGRLSSPPPGPAGRTSGCPGTSTCASPPPTASRP